VEANSTGGQGSRRAVAPSDDDDNTDRVTCVKEKLSHYRPGQTQGFQAVETP
jgi:hypothetical protein